MDDAIQPQLDVSLSRDDTLAASQIFEQTSLVESQISGANEAQDENLCCCSRLWRKFDRFIWQNEAELLQTDHLKSAPCITANTLAYLRIFMAIFLFVETIIVISETSKNDTSFQFISQWNLVALTVLFITMAIIQVRHSRRLNKFTVNVAVSQDITGQSFTQDRTVSQAISRMDENESEEPWKFWKWLIPIYNAILCVAVLLTLSFWVTVVTSSEFLLYIGDDNKVIWDLLPTLPTVCMFIEFPFNMIPFDWPMLIFVELIFLFYITLNFVIVSIEESHTTVYEAFNWYEKPWRAIGAVLVCMAMLAAIFAGIWAISQKWKLPNYKDRQENRFGSFSSTASNQNERRDVGQLMTEERPLDSSGKETIERSRKNWNSIQLNDDEEFVSNVPTQETIEADQSRGLKHADSALKAGGGKIKGMTPQRQRRPANGSTVWGPGSFGEDDSHLQSNLIDDF